MKSRICVLIFIWLVFSGLEVFSCTCGYVSPRTFYRKANAIFIGQVIGIGEGLNSSYGVPVYPVTFKVEKSWKGQKNSEITISTYDVNVVDSTRVCGGFNLVQGEKYLVYAYGKKLSVSTSSCSPPTLPVSSQSASDEIKRLNSLWFRLKARLIPF